MIGCINSRTLVFAEASAMVLSIPAFLFEVTSAIRILFDTLGSDISSLEACPHCLSICAGHYIW